jgi:hypothetical protein
MKRVGDWHRRPSASDYLAGMALAAAWVLLAIPVRKRLHRGIPSGAPQLAAGAWWLASLLPPFGLFPVLSVLTTNPPPTDVADRSYPLLPFLLLALAHPALLAWRTRRSPDFTRAQRIVIVLTSLLTVIVFLLFCMAWTVGGAPHHPGAARWTLVLAFVAAWVVLAVRTRRDLRAWS